MTKKKVPNAIQVVALYFWITAIFILSNAFDSVPWINSLPIIILTIFAVVLSIFLWKLKEWARVGMIILCFLFIINNILTMILTKLSGAHLLWNLIPLAIIIDLLTHKSEFTN